MKNRFGTINLNVMSDTDLSAGAKLVYAALSMFENPKTGQCNPSQEQLADAIGAGRATVQRGIKQLLALGYITADRNKNRAEYVLCNASKRVNALTQNDTTPVHQNDTTVVSKRVNDGIKMMPLINKEEKKRKRKRKENSVDPQANEPLKEFHRQARQLWPQISQRKYNGGELTNLFNAHGTAATTAMEKLIQQDRKINSVIPYLKKMLESEGNQVERILKNPIDIDAMNPWERQAHDSKITTIIANRADDWEPFAEVAK